jgi:hypothetical protein
MGKIAAALTAVFSVLVYALAVGPESLREPLFTAIMATFMALSALVHIYGPPSPQ